MLAERARQAGPLSAISLEEQRDRVYALAEDLAGRRDAANNSAHSDVCAGRESLPATSALRPN
jgi:hypothetical protein